MPTIEEQLNAELTHLLNLIDPLSTDQNKTLSAEHMKKMKKVLRDISQNDQEKEQLLGIIVKACQDIIAMSKDQLISIKSVQLKNIFESEDTFSIRNNEAIIALLGKLQRTIGGLKSLKEKYDALINKNEQNKWEPYTDSLAKSLIKPLDEIYSSFRDKLNRSFEDRRYELEQQTPQQPQPRAKEDIQKDLNELKEQYKNRQKEGKEYFNYLSKFFGGYRATDKLAVVNKLIEQMEQVEQKEQKELSPEEVKIASQGRLKALYLELKNAEEKEKKGLAPDSNQPKPNDPAW